MVDKFGFTNLVAFVTQQAAGIADKTDTDAYFRDATNAFEAVLRCNAREFLRSYNSVISLGEQFAQAAEPAGVRIEPAIARVQTALQTEFTDRCVCRRRR